MPRRPIATSALVALVALTTGVAPATAGGASCMGRRATIVGGPGADNLEGTAEDDVIAGLDGDDYIEGRGGSDLICAGKGDDIVGGGRGDDRLRTAGGEDRFRVGEDPGDDEFRGGRGSDWLLLPYDNCCEEPTGDGPAYVDLARGEVRVVGSGSDRVRGGSIENVYGTGQGDEIHGDAGPNNLQVGSGGGGLVDGRAGDDVLVGGEDGATTFDGGEGDDLVDVIANSNTIAGGLGTDTLSFCGPYAGTSLDVEVDLVLGTASVRDDTDDSPNALAAVENAIGCSGDDTLRGDAGANTLEGGPGNDSVEGREGDDALAGGAGVDFGDGGLGTDECESFETTEGCE